MHGEGVRVLPATTADNPVVLVQTDPNEPIDLPISAILTSTRGDIDSGQRFPFSLQVLDEEDLTVLYKSEAFLARDSLNTIYLR